MHTQRPVGWRSHVPLALSILAACGFLALITMVIMSLSSIREGVPPNPIGNSSTAAELHKNQPAGKPEKDPAPSKNSY